MTTPVRRTRKRSTTKQVTALEAVPEQPPAPEPTLDDYYNLVRDGIKVIAAEGADYWLIDIALIALRKIDLNQKQFRRSADGDLIRDAQIDLAVLSAMNWHAGYSELLDEKKS